MSRIVFVVPRFHTNLFYATKALIAAGHRVDVLVNGIGAREDHRHLTPVMLGKAPGDGVLQDILRDLDPDVVFIRTAFKLSRQAAVAARRLGLRALRYDLAPLGEAGTLKQRLLHWRRGLPQARITPVRSPGDSRERQGQAHYMPWPVQDEQGLRVGPEVMARQPVPILCVGKFGNPRKNHMALIVALDALGGAQVARLTLVGSGPHDDQDGGHAYFKSLEEAVAERPWIDLRMNLPHEEMAQIYAGHAICVLPSLDEPLGFSPVEGMVCGTIPVISDQSGSAGYLTHGTDGLRVDMKVPGALEDGLRALVQDADLRARMSAAARHTAETELSPARFVQRMEALIAAP